MQAVDRAIDLLEKAFSLSFVHAAVYFYSTRWERLAVFAACLLALACFARARRRPAAAALAAGLLAVLLPYPTLARFGVRHLMSREAERVGGGDSFALDTPDDLAWVAFDPVRRRLYACGNGTNELLALDADAPGARLRPTGLRTGWAQFCGLDPRRGELFVFERDMGRLTWADASTFAVKRRVDVGPISGPGDETYIGYDAASDVVLLVSESGREKGLEPGAALSASTGRLLGRFRHGRGEISSLVMHPRGGYAYHAFFTGARGVVRFDVARLAPVASAPGDLRLDRLAVDARREELLVASPAHGRVLAFDAETLSEKALIPATFGVRGLAIDRVRDRLLATSLLSNELVVIDLATRARVASFRLGPWLRDAALDEIEGVAYVSSRHGLYKVRYAGRLAPSSK